MTKDDLTCRRAVPEQNLIDVEGVELTAAVAIDGLCNAGEQASQLGSVVLRDH